MVFIRTDANERVATGHVMRCMTIAEKIMVMGEKVIFLFRDLESIEVLNGKMPYILLQCRDSKDEIEQMKALLQKEKKVALLLDSYDFGTEYMRQFQGLAKVITFDDMYAEKFPVDMLINYNLYYKDYDYDIRYGKEGTKLLLGGNYVPIREEFQHIEKRQAKERVKTVMLICGGGDKYHVLKALLECFCERKLYQKYQIYVIAGVLNKDLKCLMQYEKEYQNIRIYKNVSNLAAVMKEADLMVSAASTVLYECCCVGVPTLFFTMADNQENDEKVFSEDGMMYFVGDVKRDKKKVIEQTMIKLEELSKDIGMRNNMIEKMRNKIDGKGAERIAGEIVGML